MEEKDEIIEGPKLKRGKKGAPKLSAYDRKAISNIQRTTDSPFSHARGMYLRTKRKGIDYQTIDWDSVQCRDLTYNDRLDKLESMIGKTQRKTTNSIRTTEQKYKALRDNQGWG